MRAAPELGTAYRDYDDKTLANADAAFKQEYEDGSTLPFCVVFRVHH